MRILINADGLLGRVLVERLGTMHDVQTVAPFGESPGAVTIPEATGVDAIISAVRLEGSALEILDQAGRGTYNLVLSCPANTRFILLSSLRTFESYPLDWDVTEDWRPHPTPDPADLAACLAETVLREVARTLPIKGIVLRLAEIVGEGEPTNPRGVHLDDAVRAVELALGFEPPEKNALGYSLPRHGWSVFHITGGGPGSRFRPGIDTSGLLGYVPRHDVTGGRTADPVRRDKAAPPPIAGKRPERLKIAIFGACGPVGAAVAEVLHTDHDLRLCDARPVEAAAADPAIGRGAPRPRRLPPPHEHRLVDITDPDQIRTALAGVDVAINLAVVRRDPIESFRVNALGAYNLLTGGVANGIRRFVQAGPEQISDKQQGGHWPDFGIPSGVSARPGTRRYFLTKLLAQEIYRAFAEACDLEVAVLLYGHFRNPADMDPESIEGFPLVVSWADGADAIRRAATLATLPEPYQEMYVVADLPHGKVSNAAAKAALGWQPRDRMEGLWLRREK